MEIIGGVEALQRIIRTTAQLRSTNIRLSHQDDRNNDTSNSHAQHHCSRGRLNVGHVTQIIGSTFDVEFPEDHLPAIYNAVKVDSRAQRASKLNLTGEVQQHLGGGRVRCVALGSTDGMVRGMDCVDTGAPVKVPVGKATLGRVFNLLGEPIDGRGPIEAEDHWPIHRDAPPVTDLSTKTELFETGIKVIDLLDALRPRRQGRACSAGPAWARRSSSPN